MMQPKIIEVPASEFVARSHAYIKNAMLGAENFVLGVSGGSTPGPVYISLAQDKEINWNKVTIFLVDERYIAANHKDSNQKLLAETLLSGNKIPKDNLIFPNTALPMKKCVSDYEKRIQDLKVDLMILGMGPDGHTASLFPHDEAALKEAQKLVLHTTTDAFAVHDRITVTVPFLQKAKERLFLIRGEEKREKLQELMKADEDTWHQPIQAVMQAPTTWIVEKT